MSEAGPPKRKLDDADESTERGQQSKKQKLDGLPKYEFVENDNLDGSGVDSIIEMDKMVAREYMDTLYTSECSSCVALIIVAKLDNGEVWHGMRHDSDVVNSEGVNVGFELLEELIEEKRDNTIKSKDYYLVTVPELKEKRIRDVNKSKYVVTVYSPNVTVNQINDAVSGGISDADLVYLSSEISVKLSDGRIEVRYNDGSD